MSKRNKKVDLSGSPLESVYVGEVKRNKFGWIITIFVFLVFFALVYYLPEIMSLYNEYVNGDNEVVINNTINVTNNTIVNNTITNNTVTNNTITNNTTTNETKNLTQVYFENPNEEISYIFEDNKLIKTIDTIYYMKANSDYEDKRVYYANLLDKYNNLNGFTATLDTSNSTKLEFDVVIDYTKLDSVLTEEKYFSKTATEDEVKVKMVELGYTLKNS